MRFIKHPIFSFLGFVLSLAAIIILIFNVKYAAIIALVFLGLSIIVTMIVGYRAVSRVLKTKYPETYTSNCSFISYSTNDSENIVYDVYKIIQCKKGYLAQVEHTFKWSGKHPPKITSTLQEVGKYHPNHDDYDSVQLYLKDSLLYNELGLLHVKMECTDTEKISGTHISHKIKHPTEIIQMRVVLKYKQGTTKNASVTRWKADTDIQVKEPVATVVFDDSLKSYEHNLIKPEMGYIYSLGWER